MFYMVYLGKTLHILQQVRNYAACLIMRFDKNEHITHVLRYLHWRMDNKVLFYTYKVF